MQARLIADRIIYRGPRKQKFENGVEAWPVLEALRALT
jgi:hypothetical protein